MGQINYVVGRFFARWFYALAIKGEIVRPHLTDRPGGYVLACTHVSHLEPFIVTTIVKRKIDWMSRIEFYRWRLWRVFLDAFDAFPVNRFGVPVSSIRTAIARAGQGRIVGIFPEGGVTKGRESACRSGPIKGGACLVAIRANVPIVPCVILGTHSLTGFYPWVPFRRAKLWIAFGEAIPPVDNAPNRKAARKLMTAQLAAAVRALYLELLERYSLTDEMTP